MGNHGPKMGLRRRATFIFFQGPMRGLENCSMPLTGSLLRVMLIWSLKLRISVVKKDVQFFFKTSSFFFNYSKDSTVEVWLTCMCPLTGRICHMYVSTPFHSHLHQHSVHLHFPPKRWYRCICCDNLLPVAFALALFENHRPLGSSIRHFLLLKADLQLVDLFVA